MLAKELIIQLELYEKLKERYPKYSHERITKLQKILLLNK